MNIQNIQNELLPVVEGLGYEIVDVEYSKRYGQNHLTVFIAGVNGITLEDCESIHHAIDPVLDELNPSADSPYVLNVSSPGLDRPFKSPRDFERNIGNMVEVKLYAPYRGNKIYEGTLIEKLQNVVIIKHTKEGIMQFEDSKIVYVRPYVSFE